MLVPGTLYVVSTPIGNLEDITHRAIRVLGEVRVIACEDTRHTRHLLDHFGIRTPTISYHEHNEQARAAELIERLLAGDDVALVSDAGTPLVSDPGFRVVRGAVEAGVRVVPVPGASAILSGLAASGLPTDAFYFGGFLPAKAGQRRRTLESVAKLECTIVFYEAPHRVLESLAEIREVLGDREIAVSRELTKLHEETLRGVVSEVQAELAERPAIKGEITLVIARAPEAPADERPLEDAVAELVAAGAAPMDAVKQVARARGLGKREVYAAWDARKPTERGRTRAE